VSDCRQIVSGEMHYARIPRAYWRARLEMAYAMGLNAISTYVFWNRHEPRPGQFDFSGENDVAAYVAQAAAAGLGVILRPGPYVCAEWDFGGLPAWLLDGRAMAIRTTASAYMDPVRAWLKRLGAELAPLQRDNGGPIVAVQLENEYGAFGADRAYLEALRAALDEAGFAPSSYFTIDQPRDLARGGLAGVPMAATFAAGNARQDLAALRELRPGAPLLCGEFWAGWFDHWGEPHARREDEPQIADLAWMLGAGASVNLYMFHGGTNFGFDNGANAFDGTPYQPTTTSYDYQAALDEAGRPTPKYYAFRDVVAQATGIAPRPIPPSPATIEVPSFALDESAALEDLLVNPIACARPRSMERWGQSFGYALYRTTIPKAGIGVLDIGEPRDYATIRLDGTVVGRIDRRLAQRSLTIEVERPGAQLDVLVENCGRINYGPKMQDERKGIGEAVFFDGVELRDWTIFPLPLDCFAGLQFRAEARPGPAFYRGRFQLDALGDTFFDVSRLGKGSLFVNGHNAGRFWNVGPQQSLFVPGVWLRRTNEVLVFDVIGAEPTFILGRREPIIEA
jgi:beta-galactosidase